MTACARFVLASRSPRRRELLQTVVDPSAVRVLPPRSPDEAGFDNLHDWPAILRRLQEIARDKADDVVARLAAESERESERPEPGALPTVVIAADTIIIGSEPDGTPTVLGQPPETPDWPDVVRRWFADYFDDRVHSAVTGVCLTIPATGQRLERAVQSQVTFHPDTDRWIEWYIATGEPRGKAGGYAIQGAGTVFVARVDGSLSNVVGLPVRELVHMLSELGIDVCRR